jgi:hypothetical protein
MVDLVVTCPKGFWWEWIAEGDAAGDPPTGEEWGWWMSDRGPRPPIGPGDRLYIVAWGRLRGWAPVTRLHHERGTESGSWVICREAGAVACTVAREIPGFRGWRRVWWSRADEQPFPDWKTAFVPARKAA